MPVNQLINEKSPYLLQHAHNPVNWHPWSEKAFSRARVENKPVFLSIGYATCHWCHVMARESFEDDAVAAHLNRGFISIKVDREERPDVDAVYMAACQMLTGSGGWPLNLFLTPDKKPFFAATYIPKQSRFGRTGLVELCQQVTKLWASQPQKVFASAASITAGLDRAFSFSAARPPDASLLEQAFEQIKKNYDPVHGGFEPAPKFPTPHRLLFLLRCHQRTGDSHGLEMVQKTLTAMRLGGIWDHVGYGFHRYSTDQKWLLPHFEKMLYDQALIAQVYLRAYQLTRDAFLAETADQIFTYVLRDMTAAAGAFYSAEDADSEGQEGKFYVWTVEEFRRVLADRDAGHWQTILRLSPDGNFSDEAGGQKTGANIPHLTAPLASWAPQFETTPEQLAKEWAAIRRRLFKTRQKRVHPLKDDKILADWNGLMIAALALGARLLEKPAYADAARRAAQFVSERMRDGRGRLYHRFRQDELAVAAQASDFSFLVHGLLELYRATDDPGVAEQAAELQQQMIDEFWDEKKGGFFSTAQNAAELPVRPKELYDGAIPSANSVALLNLLELNRVTGDAKWQTRAEALIRAFSATVQAQPTAFTCFLLGLERFLE